MEETKSTTIELKDIETMPCKEFNDMIGKLLHIRYPESDRIEVDTYMVYAARQGVYKTEVKVGYN